jgi:hypothetical protein
MYALAWIALVATLYAGNRLYTDNKNVSSVPRIRKLLEERELIYLLGYPFTGTAAALRIMEKLSGKSMATNNGVRIATADGFEHDGVYSNKAIDDALFPNGPYLHNVDLEPASSTMLVESMCGGFCFNCREHEMYGVLNNYQDWARSCRTAHRFDTASGKTFSMPPYSFGGVLSKAVVMVRNPVPTVVARFIDSVSNDDYYVKNGLVNRKGLLVWCKKIDDAAMELPSFRRMLHETHVMPMRYKLPCISEFVRLTMWYNNLNKMLEGMDHTTVKFEDFTKQLDVAVSRLVKFTEVEAIAEVEESLFHRGGKRYHFMNEEEFHYAREVMRAVASDETWYMFQLYFSLFAPQATA